MDDARAMADDAIEKLYHNGLLKGHPAKPYYEAMDGVGNLLIALLQLDQVLHDRVAAAERTTRDLGLGSSALSMENR